MNLAIEIVNIDNDLIVDLIDLKLLTSKKALIIDNGSHLTSGLFALIKRSDSDSIFDTLTSEQRIIATYFYLNTYITSDIIIKRWLTEVNLNHNLLSQVNNLIRNARIHRYEVESVEHEINSILNSTIEKSSDKSGSFSDDVKIVHPDSGNIFFFKEIDLAIETLIKYHRVFWRFSDPVKQPDQLSEISLPQAYIAGIKELSILLIDHDSVIIGLTVSYTLLIQVVADDNLQLVESLCSYFPLGIRDKITVAYAITESPLLKLLLSSHYDKIELHGFNNLGKLCMISSNLSILEYFTNEGQEFLPYYLRFKRIKR